MHLSFYLGCQEAQTYIKFNSRNNIGPSDSAYHVLSLIWILLSSLFYYYRHFKYLQNARNY